MSCLEVSQRPTVYIIIGRMPHWSSALQCPANQCEPLLWRPDTKLCAFWATFVVGHHGPMQNFSHANFVHILLHCSFSMAYGVVDRRGTALRCIRCFFFCFFRHSVCLLHYMLWRSWCVTCTDWNYFDVCCQPPQQHDVFCFLNQTMWFGSCFILLVVRNVFDTLDI